MAVWARVERKMPFKGVIQSHTFSDAKMLIRFIMYIFLIFSAPGVIAAIYLYGILFLAAMIMKSKLDGNFIIFLLTYTIGLLGWIGLTRLIFTTKEYLIKSKSLKIMILLGIVSNFYFFTKMNNLLFGEETGAFFSGFMVNYIALSPICFTVFLIIYRLMDKFTPSTDYGKIAVDIEPDPEKISPSV
ncbi:hypothetical protein [Elstera cyanobacteriorum]|uniref:hypothetical protein n=3 Tax=Elstera cyanobacteriorum TaxID=2022747 RepID=UPI00113FF8F1|nr:hypothetical protein [Elstera cyanobacteriorum]